MRTITLSLIKSAFELRSQGMTWNEIGQHLHRKGKSCQQWTWRYREHWHLFDQDAHRSFSTDPCERRSTVEIGPAIEAKTANGDGWKIKTEDITGQKMPSAVLKDHGRSFKTNHPSLTIVKEATSHSGTSFALFLRIWQRFGLLWILFQAGYYRGWSAFKTLLKAQNPVRWMPNSRPKPMNRSPYPPEPVYKGFPSSHSQSLANERRCVLKPTEGTVSQFSSDLKW